MHFTMLYSIQDVAPFVAIYFIVYHLAINLVWISFNVIDVVRRLHVFAVVFFSLVQWDELVSVPNRLCSRFSWPLFWTIWNLKKTWKWLNKCVFSLLLPGQHSSSVSSSFLVENTRSECRNPTETSMASPRLRALSRSSSNDWTLTFTSRIHHSEDSRQLHAAISRSGRYLYSSTGALHEYVQPETCRENASSARTSTHRREHEANCGVQHHPVSGITSSIRIDWKSTRSTDLEMSADSVYSAVMPVKYI